MRARTSHGRLLCGTALAMLLGAPGAARAAPRAPQPGAAPDGFVRAVYARYKAHGPGVPMTRPGGSGVYSPALLDAFAGAAASTPAGDIGPIDDDPLCACQDFDDLRLETVAVAHGGPGRATARVALADAGARRTLILSLVHTPAGWRVDDVGAPGRRTVAAVLRAATGPKAR